MSRVQMIEVDGKPVVEDDDMRYRQAVAMADGVRAVRARREHRAMTHEQPAAPASGIFSNTA